MRRFLDASKSLERLCKEHPYSSKFSQGEGNLLSMISVTAPIDIFYRFLEYEETLEGVSYTQLFEDVVQYGGKPVLIAILAGAAYKFLPPVIDDFKEMLNDKPTEKSESLQTDGKVHYTKSGFTRNSETIRKENGTEVHPIDAAYQLFDCPDNKLVFVNGIWIEGQEMDIYDATNPDGTGSRLELKGRMQDKQLLATLEDGNFQDASLIEKMREVYLVGILSKVNNGFKPHLQVLHFGEAFKTT